MSIRIILVELSEQHNSRFKDALLCAGFQVLSVVRETDDLFTQVVELQPDAIIIESESPKRDTLEHLAGISAEFPKPMVMLAEQADSLLIKMAADAGVSVYAVDRLSPSSLRSLVEVTMLHFNSRHALETQLAKARQNLQDKEIIDRAKRALMRLESLPEEIAYKTMREMAMNRGWRLAKLAEYLLKKMPT